MARLTQTNTPAQPAAPACSWVLPTPAVVWPGETIALRRRRRRALLFSLQLHGWRYGPVACSARRWPRERPGRGLRAAQVPLDAGRSLIVGRSRIFERGSIVVRSLSLVCSLTLGNSQPHDPLRGWWPASDLIARLRQVSDLITRPLQAAVSWSHRAHRSSPVLPLGSPGVRRVDRSSTRWSTRSRPLIGR